MKSQMDVEGGVVVAGDLSLAATTLIREPHYEAVQYGPHDVPDPAWVTTCMALCGRVHRWENGVVVNAVRYTEPGYYCEDCRDEHDGAPYWLCECGQRVVPIWKREPGGVKHVLVADETSVMVTVPGAPPARIEHAELRYTSPEGHAFVVPLPVVLHRQGDVTFAAGETPTYTYTGSTPVAPGGQ